jgi:hypothetical protein
MKTLFAAALALPAISSLQAQAVVAVDPSYAMPVPGTWSYVPVANGSEARFADSSARVQLVVRCVRATRKVSISKPASGAVPNLTIWTSSLSRSIPASFNPATSQATAELAAFDPIFDAIAFSRGRFAVNAAGVPSLVLPPWADVARVVEDCRA